MFSRYPQQPILVDSVLLIVSFALHHYTYLIEGADFPIGITYIKSIWLPVQRNKSNRTGTCTMPVICADCCSGCSAAFQRHILYSHRRGAANQVGMLIEDVDGCLSTIRPTGAACDPGRAVAENSTIPAKENSTCRPPSFDQRWPHKQR
jgi:hypothetical protein